MFGFLKKKKQKIAEIKETKSGEEITNGGDQGLLVAIQKIQDELNQLKLVIARGDFEIKEKNNAENELIQKKEIIVTKSESEKIVEGVFDGESMIGADGQRYDVPANYASKSKLVEGDILKLSINNLGSFIFKQIKPIERLRKIGQLERDEQNLQYYAVVDGKKWRLLTASVTYYKGEVGDEVVFLIPMESGSRWAAVENIVKN